MQQMKDEARARAARLVHRARKQLSQSVASLVTAGHANQAETIGKALAALDPIFEVIGDAPGPKKKQKSSK
jgi:F0F1-type ATP synthase membrane subunit b/b'